MRFAFVFVVVISYSSICQGFKVSPIELDFSPLGPESVQTIRLENNEENPIPIEITAYRRVQEHGKEKRLPTNDFYFFPKQLILKPGEKRNVRITWMGERPVLRNKSRMAEAQFKFGNRKIKKEMAYRLEVKQVPVDLKKKEPTQTGIKFIYNYVASLYVRPSGVKPKIVAKKIVRVSKNKIKAQISNKGGSHGILSQYKALLKVKGLDSAYDISKQSNEFRGINLLSGETREVTLDLPPKISTGSLNLTFEKR